MVVVIGSDVVAVVGVVIVVVGSDVAVEDVELDSTELVVVVEAAVAEDSVVYACVVSEGSRFGAPGSQNWAPMHPV